MKFAANQWTEKSFFTVNLPSNRPHGRALQYRGSRRFFFYYPRRSYGS